VAFVSDANEFAGAEQYMMFIIAGLRSRYDFVVVAGTDAADEFRKKVIGAGAGFVAVPGLKRRPGVRVPLRLARVLKTLELQLVHVNLSDQGDGIAPLLGARLGRVPVVATLHNVIPGRARRREAVSKPLLRLPAVMIAVSDRLGRYLLRRRPHNVVIKNAVPAPRLDPAARARLSLPSDAFVVGGIGRLHAQKGWDVLCRAAARVHETRPDIRFVVVGEGPERDAIEQEPTAAHIDFHGYVADASSLLGAFDLLAIPSRYEGLGLVAIEAMLAGVAIVATDIEGLVEAIGPAGRLVPPDNPEALAESILELASDPGARSALTKEARTRAEKHFTYDRMVDETRNVYEHVIDKGAR
jgi:glycosyltransferase involved in cell wall biosynthesis